MPTRLQRLCDQQRLDHRRRVLANQFVPREYIVTEKDKIAFLAEIGAEAIHEDHHAKAFGAEAVGSLRSRIQEVLAALRAKAQEVGASINWAKWIQVAITVATMLATGQSVQAVIAAVIKLLFPDPTPA